MAARSRPPAHFAVDDVVERKASLPHLVKVEAIHADDALAATRALAQPNKKWRQKPPCTNINPGSPEGGRPARRDSEPAELRTDP